MARISKAAGLTTVLGVVFGFILCLIVSNPQPPPSPGQGLLVAGRPVRPEPRRQAAPHGPPSSPPPPPPPPPPPLSAQPASTSRTTPAANSGARLFSPGEASRSHWQGEGVAATAKGSNGTNGDGVAVHFVLQPPRNPSNLVNLLQNVAANLPSEPRWRIVLFHPTKVVKGGFQRRQPHRRYRPHDPPPDPPRAPLQPSSGNCRA